SSDSAAGGNVRLYSVSGTSITPIPVQVGSAAPQGSTREYFADYYSRAAISMSGYTYPYFTAIDGSGNPGGDLRLIRMGGKLYCVLATGGLGDVYELRSGDTISAKVKKVGHAANSKAAAFAASGPFYGDEITFTSTSTAVNPPTVNWSFTGDALVYSRTPADPDIPYQFG